MVGNLRLQDEVGIMRCEPSLRRSFRSYGWGQRKSALGGQPWTLCVNRGGYATLLTGEIRSGLSAINQGLLMRYQKVSVGRVNFPSDHL